MHRAEHLGESALFIWHVLLLSKATGRLTVMKKPRITVAIKIYKICWSVASNFLFLSQGVHPPRRCPLWLARPRTCSTDQATKIKDNSVQLTPQFWGPPSAARWQNNIQCSSPHKKLRPVRRCATTGLPPCPASQKVQRAPHKFVLSAHD